jgi:hypothetical protein
MRIDEIESQTAAEAGSMVASGGRLKPPPLTVVPTLFRIR